MIAFIHQISTRRPAWLLLTLSALGFELTGLFFQHVMKLDPCVMCIYERVAFWGIVGGGLLGLIQPRWFWLRWTALAVWGYSAFTGLRLALQHVDYQLNPSPFNSCSLFVEFPSWLPLDKWMPWMFTPTGDCSEIQWQFLGWSMAQWLIPIFSAFLLAFLVVALANLKRGRCCS